MKKLILPLLALGLQVATAQQAAPTVGTSLDTIYKQAKEPSVASQDSKEPTVGVPFTTDTQIRFLSLIEPATNKEILHVSDTKPKEADTLPHRGERSAQDPISSFSPALRPQLSGA